MGRREGFSKLMRLPRLFYSFRTRLLLVMALLLVATLGVQFYLNRLQQQRHAVVIADQEQALTASIALANESITSGKYLYELDNNRKVSFLKEQAGRVVNVLVVREDGRVDDSLDPKFRPETVSEGSYHYYNVSELHLPKLVDAGEVSEGFRRVSSLPTTAQAVAGEPRTFAIPLQTDEGMNYVVVVLGRSPATEESFWRTARQLLPTLAVLLLATSVAALLVWSFTRPVRELSRATQRVAAGDFSFRVPAADRRAPPSPACR